MKRSIVALFLLAAACAGDLDEGQELVRIRGETFAPSSGAPARTAPPLTEPTTPPTPAPTTLPTAAPTTATPMPGPESRPPASVTATLDFSYHSAGTFDPGIMGFGVGEVVAEWYSAEDHYVVVFAALDLNAVGPLCPGASIHTGAAFEFVANVATEGADCSSFPTLTGDPDVRAFECGGVLSFRTAIPAGTDGTLYGTLERPDSGGIIGITSTVDSTTGDFPEIDLTTLSC